MKGTKLQTNWMAPGNEDGLSAWGPRSAQGSWVNKERLSSSGGGRWNTSVGKARKDDPPDTDRYDHMSGILPPPVGSRAGGDHPRSFLGASTGTFGRP